MIEISNLTKIYNSGEYEVRALDGVSEVINDGETVAVIGKSGSGKTTLLNIIGGMDVPTSGEILIDGKNIVKSKEKELSAYRLEKIGFIFQFFCLIPTLTVKENIMLPMLIAGKSVEKEFYDELVCTLGLEEKQHCFPNQLSGGQKQRVAIGRAMIHKPKVVLADEPTGNLDSVTSQEILDLLLSCAAKYNQTVMVVTHDMEVAQQCGRIIEILDGKIV